MSRLLRRWPALAVVAAALIAGLTWAATAPSADPAAPRASAAATPAAPASSAAAAHRAGRRARIASARRAQRRAAISAQRRAERRAARRAAHRAERRAATHRVRAVTRAARSRIGSPYAWGATGPHAFDCSGLTQWSLRRAGVGIARSSFAQAQAGKAVGRAHIRAGDLVFFSTAGPGASHVGIATSRHTAVSATSSGVRTHAISDAYWGSHFVGARRVLRS
jgi:cell wall-associated NlpC family hydrolase